MPCRGYQPARSRDALIGSLGKQLMTISDVTGSERSKEEGVLPDSLAW